MKNTDLSAEPEKTLQATEREEAWVPVRYHRKKDGTIIPVEISASHFIWRGNAVHIAAIRDITDRKNMEAAMVEAEKMATLGTLAAGIAHEINSPLQVITGLSDRHTRLLAQQKIDPDLLKHDFETISRNAWRVANIVRSLLTYSRTTVERVSQSNLSDIVRDALLLIEHQLTSWANIQVETELATDLPPIYCEHNNISQVVINLLTNARDAMPNSGKITIRTAFHPGSKRFILQVSDTGQGIPEEIRTKIFDPFFTTKEVGKGTGLGLSIVSSIVQAHGGTIHVDSQLDHGTVFTVHLPQKPPFLASDKEPSIGRFED